MKTVYVQTLPSIYKSNYKLNKNYKKSNIKTRKGFYFTIKLLYKVTNMIKILP